MLGLRITMVLGAAALLAMFSTAPAGAAPRIGVKDLLAVKWVKDVSLSPDGKWAAFVV